MPLDWTDGEDAAMARYRGESRDDPRPEEDERAPVTVRITCDDADQARRLVAEVLLWFKGADVEPLTPRGWAVVLPPAADRRVTS